MRKYLIVNADDFGLSPSVNRAIEKCFRKGSISSTTMMANLPGFHDGIARLERNPDLSVGLHFNLTYGRPLLKADEVPTLVNHDGNFSGNTNQWSGADIERELHAQWNRLVRHHVRPTHIDSHNHIQMYPAVYRPMVQLAQKMSIGMRKIGWEPKLPDVVHPITTEHFILDVYSDDSGATKLQTYLRQLKPGVTELMCHPGLVDKYVRRYSAWTDVREKEFLVFYKSPVESWILESGIDLITYEDLSK